MKRIRGVSYDDMLPNLALLFGVAIIFSGIIALYPPAIAVGILLIVYHNNKRG